MSAIARARNLLRKAVLSPGHWNVALDAFAKACGGRSGQLIALNPEGRVVLHRLTEAPDDFSAMVENYGLADPLLNPRMRAGRTAQVMRAVADQDYVSTADRAQLPIYNDIFVPHDFPHNCQIVLIREQNVLVRASVTRTRQQGPFDADALKVFRVLAPLLQSAVRAHVSMELTETTASLRALDAIQAPAFVLNQRGQIIATSARAAALVESGVGVRLIAGRLVLQDPAAMEALEQGLRALETSAAYPFEVANAGYVLDVQPLPSERDHFGLGPAAIAVMRQPQTPAASRAVLQHTFALTPAEAAVADALARGARVKDIAHRRRVSLPTVRSQVQSAYGKLGVRRQAELVALVHKLRG